jgi:hypothetical protein
MDDQRKYKCAKRELRLRKQVYPLWVRQGRMSQAEANYEITVMEEICKDYEEKTREPFCRQLL